jgi:hypothetical protein
LKRRRATSKGSFSLSRMVGIWILKLSAGTELSSPQF